jgi:hypothetical protein
MAMKNNWVSGEFVVLVNPPLDHGSGNSAPNVVKDAFNIFVKPKVVQDGQEAKGISGGFLEGETVATAK